LKVGRRKLRSALIVTSNDVMAVHELPETIEMSVA